MQVGAGQLPWGRIAPVKPATMAELIERGTITERSANMLPFLKIPETFPEIVDLDAGTTLASQSDGEDQTRAADELLAVAPAKKVGKSGVQSSTKAATPVLAEMEEGKATKLAKVKVPKAPKGKAVAKVSTANVGAVLAEEEEGKTTSVLKSLPAKVPKVPKGKAAAKASKTDVGAALAANGEREETSVLKSSSAKLGKGKAAAKAKASQTDVGGAEGGVAAVTPAAPKAKAKAKAAPVRRSKLPKDVLLEIETLQVCRVLCVVCCVLFVAPILPPEHSQPREISSASSERPNACAPDAGTCVENERCWQLADAIDAVGP